LDGYIGNLVPSLGSIASDLLQDQDFIVAVAKAING